MFTVEKNVLVITCLVLERINNVLPGLQLGSIHRRTTLSRYCYFFFLHRKYDLFSLLLLHFCLQEFRKYKQQLESKSFCPPTPTIEAPATKRILPSDGRALRVFTDIPQVEEFLRRPEFVLSKSHFFYVHAYFSMASIIFLFIKVLDL